MKDKNKPTEKTVLEVLSDCARLKYDLDKTFNIIRARFPNNIHLASLYQNLTTPGTAEYNAYHSAIDLGEYEIEEALYNDATSGSKTSVNSHDALHTLQKEKTINDAIREKFFPDDE